MHSCGDWSHDLLYYACLGLPAILAVVSWLRAQSQRLLSGRLTVANRMKPTGCPCGHGHVLIDRASILVAQDVRKTTPRK